MAHQEIDQKVEVEHEHTLKVEGIGGMGWICALGVIVCLMFEGEIRCSLGNQAECVKMLPKPAENKSPNVK
jgi:hypothetical protein